VITSRSARALGAALVLALGVTGCAGPGQLVSETGHHRLTAKDDASGLTVVLTTEVWNGAPEEVDESWTVLHLLVANLGDAPILLAPGDFELTDLRGFRYALVDVGGAFHRLDDGPPGPTTAYGFEERRDYDPGGPVEFVPIWGEGDMNRLALPWGVLEPGTQMRGFLYFEPLERTANGGRLVWHVTSPDHVPVVDLQFDLRVARPKSRR
jgi:hypothetical protein